jgi:MoaA/NifB/PqqE/SkfB family radical SAM enzyme
MVNKIQYLQFEPTTRCNFTCGFCAGRHMQQTDIELDHFAQVIDALDDLRHIELQGEGEPLLHPHFFQMIQYARRRFPNVRISFITNGSLFTHDNISRIIDSSVDSIMVSIESADEDEFQNIRGGKLSKVKRGIKDLVDRKNRTCGKLKIGFAVTVLKQTVNQINMIGELYERLGMDGGIVVQPLQSMDCYAQFYDSEMKKSIPNVNDRIKLNGLIAGDVALRESLSAFNKERNFYSDLFSSVDSGSNTCAWLENGLFISANGIACSCCFTKDSRRDGLGQFENGFPTILEKRSEMLNKLKAGDMPSSCRGCGIARKIQLQAKNG